DSMQRIFLTGLSGAGKSTIGRLVANLLGWQFFDTDELIAAQVGQPAGQVLSDVGEARFRRLESEALQMASLHEAAVIATGGGAVIAETNRRLIRERGLVVYLHTSVEIAWQRLAEQMRRSEAADIRPLLAGDNGQSKLHALYQTRQPWYEEATLHLSTDNETPERLALQVIAGAIASGALLTPEAAPEHMMLDLGRTTSQAIVEWGGLAHLPQALQTVGLPRRVFMITDSAVGGLYTGPLQQTLRQAGFDPQVFTIPAGEFSKSLAWFTQIMDWLVSQRAEQQEAIIALGGGVVGDLAGFVAASYRRGVPLVQVPTTLLAQVDSAIGGKTGINHPQGKNLIGAFYQPRLTLVDPACLLTLPERVYREGWGEIIKYGMALDAELFGQLERADGIVPTESAALSQIIARCIRLKMQIVQGDERDQGQRAILNYGHTFGHALEAVTEYSTWLHGEAVSIGMEVATRLAVVQGVLTAEEAERQRTVLRAFGLPVACTDLDISAALAAMQQDKKVRNGRMRWVLLDRIGHAAVYSDIPLSAVQEAIETVIQRSASTASVQKRG
ncbi:MAG TPA: 3-dehydroquinate synthase, partial [Ktedonobacterales bacterium]|nr:3-dehydroquinate synthase [Ktedonobacterales bacterium]